MKTEQNYLALDLELNSDGKKTSEIIQVGIAIGNINDGVFLKDQKLVKFNFDLDQQISNHKLHDFIQNLTGISQKYYDEEAVTPFEISKWLSEKINTYKTFVNPVTWGLGDSDELLRSFKAEGIQFPYFGHRVLDVKHFYLYIEAANGRNLSGGLKSAMGRYKLNFKGTPHRADCDAENTLNFYFYLLKRQNKIENILKTVKFDII